MVQFENLVFNVKFLYSAEIYNKTHIRISVYDGQAHFRDNYHFEYETEAEARVHFCALKFQIEVAENRMREKNN